MHPEKKFELIHKHTSSLLSMKTHMTYRFSSMLCALAPPSSKKIYSKVSSPLKPRTEIV